MSHDARQILPAIHHADLFPGALLRVRGEVRAELERRAPHVAALHDEAALLAAPLPERTAPRTWATLADRMRGALYGAAIGDALGNTSESKLPDVRRARHGEVRDYLPNRHAEGRAVGLPSDDTQLLVWTLEAIFGAGRPDLDALVTAYKQAPIFGMGDATHAFFDALVDGADPWEARQASAGNGALMRMPGAMLPYCWTGGAGGLDAVALTSALTHDDPASTAACVAFATMLHRALWGGLDWAQPGVFWQTYVEIARPIEGFTRYASRNVNDPFEGAIWQRVAEDLPSALAAGEGVLEAGDRWYSAAYLLETVPCALLILERHAHDPEEAIVRAVNDTKDNDTIAAIVGALVGALHGYDALPRRWCDGLLGRTTFDDDGRLARAWNLLRAHGGRDAA